MMESTNKYWHVLSPGGGLPINATKYTSYQAAEERAREHLKNGKVGDCVVILEAVATLTTGDAPVTVVRH